MPRSHDSGKLDLREVFRRVQRQTVAQLAVDRLFEHASSAGAATVQHWLELFRRYLPRRYRATPASVIDSAGRRSRQIDIAIFDNLYSPLPFPHDSGVHVPAESVYAVFEVKPTISKQWIRDAAVKAATVRALRRTSRNPKRILAGLLATSSVWNPKTFAANLRRALAACPLDIGCSLEHGAFELCRTVRVSSANESLIFFVLRLIERLCAMGPTPAADLMQYGHDHQSFRDKP